MDVTDMKMTVTLTAEEIQGALNDVIALKLQVPRASLKDGVFTIAKKNHGDQRDTWQTYELESYSVNVKGDVPDYHNRRMNLGDHIIP